MLTRLRFKNWRSLRDVTIDLSPITVFIGANATGKTNILDALYFIRHATNKGVMEAVYSWQGFARIHTFGVSEDEPIELGLTLSDDFYYDLTLQFDKPAMRFHWFKEEFKKGDQTVSQTVTSGDTAKGIIVRSLHDLQELIGKRANKIKREQVQEIIHFIERWQMLDENFMPPLSLRSGEVSDLYVIDECADNLVFVLDFMRQTRPELFDQLQEDLRWILGYVEAVGTERTEHETRLLLKEKTHRGEEAPSISAGTARLVAMLTTFYMLDMRYPQLPGLVVIEEPDTALNPGVLRNFVEQLRYFTTGEHPRQVILTTHNPVFLDYFEPEEVRVVERDEQGYTTVNPLPEHVREIWLDKYTLGEVWRTNSLGGLP